VIAAGAARVLAGVALALVLAGCAAIPFLSADPASLGADEAFELHGRVYVRFAARAFSGSIRWQHAREQDEVWLAGPLGQTAAHIVRDVQGATLTTADRQVYRAMSLAALTRRGLGWTLPLADLSYYVLGARPDAKENTRVIRDAADRLSEVLHDGWAVAFGYGADDHAKDRPVRLVLRQDDVEIRLVIDSRASRPE
jgi:outer membrane lipoprotein LolB